MSNRWRGTGGTADRHLDLLTPVLARLRALGKPFMVENVPGAKHLMRATLMLHGGMFGLDVDRPRIFESNTLILAPLTPRTKNPVGVYGKAHDGRLLWARADGSEQRAASSLEEAQRLMGMPWANWHGCKEALPPAYTEFIGCQLREHVKRSGRVTTVADLPVAHYILAALDDITSAAVPHDDPLAPLARRWLNGKRNQDAHAALWGWLRSHPEYRITRLPDPQEEPLRTGQLTLWDAA